MDNDLRVVSALQSREGPFPRAYRTAKRLGKPLLALLPLDAEASFDQHQTVRDLLAWGSASERVPLTLCRTIRISEEENHFFFGSPKRYEQYQMKLIETNVARPCGHLLHMCLDFSGNDPVTRRWRYQRLASDLTAYLVGDLTNVDALEVRARESASTLSSADRQEVERALKDREVPSARLCDRAAAMVALAAAESYGSEFSDRLTWALGNVARVYLDDEGGLR